MRSAFKLRLQTSEIAWGGVLISTGVRICYLVFCVLREHRRHLVESES